jgi:CRP-like cAMP-binding protein/predicted GNAT family N-acyltransferase
MDAPPVIRFAETPEEREAIFRQRFRIYAEEMGVYRSSADHARKQLSDANDATGRLLYAAMGTEVVASIRIHGGVNASIPEGFVTVYDLGRFTPAAPYAEMGIVTRFLVDARHRASSISFRLMAACYDYLVNQGVHLVFVACAPHLINLYLALGFRTYTHNFNDPDVGFVVPMVLFGRDTEYLKKIRSPLLAKVIDKIVPTGGTVPAGASAALESVVQSEVTEEQEYWSQVFGLLSEQSEGRHGILDGLSGEQTHSLLSKGHLIECSKGDLIIKKGATSTGMHIIMSGTVEVRDGCQVVATLGKGEILGEMAFLLASPRSADVYAASDDVQILSTDEKTLRELVDTEPAIAARFLLNLSKSLCLRLVAMRARSSVAPIVTGSAEETNRKQAS